ncbi:RNA polymerase sigma factor [Fulvivirgaceae bacterium PWU5]|uniref:RNA polymerase sigma factor n=2 Tax=Dawidia cretensis TaxID=2782350 RepID=A0AAP2GND3_9BACT|nr:RNA polymerase sigma factor [Dawidia cretensis]
MIFRVSILYTKSEDDRKDLFQEIVIQLWKSIDAFRSDSKISTWIYRIALNTAITQFRKNKKQIPQIPIDDVVLNYAEHTDLYWEERVKVLYKEIQSLNDLDKGIIFLYLEDKPYEEIARVTGLTLTNVATRLSRIKQKLKSQITPI